MSGKIGEGASPIAKFRLLYIRTLTDSFSYHFPWTFRGKQKIIHEDQTATPGSRQLSFLPDWSGGI